jgi:hypothetical protein
MQSNALCSDHEFAISETELFFKVQYQIMNLYDVDEKLACEMAWDLIEVLTAVDSNMRAFEKFFLH